MYSFFESDAKESLLHSFFRRKNSLTRFKLNVPFQYPLKTSENLWLSDVLMDIEIEHWLKMD